MGGKARSVRVGVCGVGRKCEVKRIIILLCHIPSIRSKQVTAFRRTSPHGASQWVACWAATAPACPSLPTRPSPSLTPSSSTSRTTFITPISPYRPHSPPSTTPSPNPNALPPHSASPFLSIALYNLQRLLSYPMTRTSPTRPRT